MVLQGFQKQSKFTNESWVYPVASNSLQAFGLHRSTFLLRLGQYWYACDLLQPCFGMGCLAGPTYHTKYRTLVVFWDGVSDRDTHHTKCMTMIAFDIWTCSKHYAISFIWCVPTLSDHCQERQKPPTHLSRVFVADISVPCKRG